MRKVKKVLKIVFISVASLVLVALISGAIILEPAFKLKGFSCLKADKLGYLSNQISFIDQDNKAVSDKIISSSALYSPIDSVNQHTVDAFVSVEDKRFFDHKGVDFLRVMGAGLRNAKSGSYKEGASTISQQLIKNTHLTNKKTLKRKVEEIRIARELERKYSKEEILNMYLNSLYFGNGIYGIGAASKTYFNTQASELTLDQSATLAAMINSPAKYCPYSKYDACMKRRDLVLGRMLKNNKISEESYVSAISNKTVIAENAYLLNQYFVNATSEIAELLNCNVFEVRQRKLTIKTYFDQELSDFIEETYSDFHYDGKEKTDFSCIVIDNENSNVVAYYGTGRKNYLKYRRSPASTIKPIISYAPAIESGNIYPISPILDEKISFDGYSPSNYLDKYHGWTTVEDSLSTSSNITAVKLLDMCGIKYAKKIGSDLGLTFGKQDNALALALGGMENGLTLQEIANAYQTFANEGLHIKSSYIKSIADENGNTIYKDNRPKNRAISKETAFLMNTMLERCAKKGTARQLKSLDNIAAKTGTNGTKEGNTDAYCISYSKKFTVAVWIGAKNGLMPNYISGGTIPSKLNKIVMSRILETKVGAGEKFSVPNGIQKLCVDKEALEKQHKVILANDMTPPIQKIEAYFDKRNIPSETSIKYFNKYLLYKDKNIFSA